MTATENAPKLKLLTRIEIIPRMYAKSIIRIDFRNPIVNSKGVFLNGVGNVKLDLFSRLKNERRLLKMIRRTAKANCDLKQKKIKNGIDEAMFSINLNFM